jgi:hypothetical protein
MRCEGDRLELADCRCLTILEWRLLVVLAAQTAASMAEGQQAFVPIQSLPMQINADAVCLVRTEFQQMTFFELSRPTMLSRPLPRRDQRSTRRTTVSTGRPGEASVRKNRGNDALALASTYVDEARPRIIHTEQPFKDTPEYRQLLGDPLRIAKP